METRTLGKDERLSRSGQILVRSPDARGRGVMASFAETVSEELGRILGDRRVAWNYPIEIETKGKMSDVGVSGRTLVTRIDLIEGNKFVLHLYVKLSDEFSGQQFSRELLRLLLLERMLRNQRSADALEGKRLEVPHWVLSGVHGLIEHRRLGSPSDFYAGIVRSRQLLSADEILKANPDSFDSLSKATYEASAAALLGALFDQKNGVKNFGSLLSRLILFDGDAQLLLKEEFPGLRGGEHSVDKWWSLQIAMMGEMQAMEYRSAKDTESLLNEALSIKFSAEKQEVSAKAKKPGFWEKLNPFGKKKYPEFTSGRIHDFEQFYKRKDCKKMLEQNQRQLRALRYHCFPLYAPVISKYEIAVSRLMKGKRKRLAEDLLELDEELTRIGETVMRVTDFLNYYEATQLEEPGGDFERYHQASEKIRQGKPPVRKDRISKYLDEVEREFSGEVGR
ncbi:MAG: hypothetical protein GXP30_07825 [Verrucomicrobia bacterium]|nr:hypothetical protein [Verrucomicrobiota bacterium]